MTEHIINDASWSMIKDGAGTVDLVATGKVFYMQCDVAILDAQPIPPKPPDCTIEWLVKGGRNRRLTVLAGLKGYCRCVDGEGSGTVEVTEVV